MSADTAAASEHRKTESLPEELRAFYRQRGIALDNRVDALAPRLRFVRLNMRFDRQETVRRLRTECAEHVKGQCGGEPGEVSSYPLLVPWLDEEWGFYALPGDFPLSQSPCFRSGRVYGQDVSSGAAVAVLLTDTYNYEAGAASELVPASDPFRVLDLCCAPGLKLCALADWLKSNSIWSEVVGVDISEARVNVCKRVIHKYHIDSETSGEFQNESLTETSNSNDDSRSGVHIQVYCHDGTSFLLNNSQCIDLVFDSVLANEQLINSRKRKRLNKSARARQAKQLKLLQQTVTSTNDDGSLRLFDRVLLDAECSTDGSMKHLRKRIQKSDCASSWQKPLMTDNDELEALIDLQKRLATNAFRLLKPGGTLVYSTCSMDEKQNEGVVRWLLETFEDAKLVPLFFSEPSIKDVIVNGSLPGTLRFLPVVSAGGPDHARTLASGPSTLFGDGFFLAKVMKAPCRTK